MYYFLLACFLFLGCAQENKNLAGGSDHPNELTGVAMVAGNSASYARVQLLDTIGYTTLDTAIANAEGLFRLAYPSDTGRGLAIHIQSADLAFVHLYAIGSERDLGTILLKASARLKGTLPSCDSVHSLALLRSPYKMILDSVCAYDLYPVYPSLYVYEWRTENGGVSSSDTIDCGSDPIRDVPFKSPDVAPAEPAASDNASSSATMVSSSSVTSSSSSSSSSSVHDITGLAEYTLLESEMRNSTFQMKVGAKLLAIFAGYKSDVITKPPYAVKSTVLTSFTADQVQATNEESGTWTITYTPVVAELDTFYIHQNGIATNAERVFVAVIPVP